MRSIVVAAVAFAFASSASAAAIDTYSHGSSGGGAGKVTHTYQWDLAHKRCHDESGRFVKSSLCTPPPVAGPNRCRDPKTGRFVKCGPGQRP